MSKVFYFGPRSPPSDIVKGQRLFEVAGLNECFEEGDIVAIKIHCGEWNNTGYLRPSFIASIVETVKEYGGDPFVCDTTTCYLAARGTALDLVNTATRNGFTAQTLGCPFVVADGEYGLDDVRVPVHKGVFLKHAYMAEAIANADSLIVLSHFKGHPQGVFGGALKNLGIGCSSKQGKSMVHLFQHPKWGLSANEFHPEKCTGKDCPVYKRCGENCPSGSFSLSEEKPYAQWNRDTCIGCYECGIRRTCGVVVEPKDSKMVQYFPAVIADAAKAYVEHVGRERVGFINYAVDISPGCDCLVYSDIWMLPNLGVFSSKNPVAIDKACLDAADRSQAVSGSRLYDEELKGEPWKAGNEKFTNILCAFRKIPVSQWTTINAAVLNGLGEAKYDLVEAELGPPEKYLSPRFRIHYPGYTTRKAFMLHKPKVDPTCYLDEPRVTLEELQKKPE